MSNISGRFSRRSIALFWLVLVAVVIVTLIALEQIAILYVLATIAIVTLLLIVAFSDLEHVGRENIENLGSE